MPLLKKGSVRPPSPNPGYYVWVETKEGCYWRRKRGTQKTAQLNNAYQEGTERMRLSAPAASRIMQQFKRYGKGLDMGRLHAKISGIFRKALKEKGRFALSNLNNLNCQPYHPFEHLLMPLPAVKLTAKEIVVTIPIYKNAVHRMNTLVTDFYFELILVYGDVTKENGLRMESEETGIYAMGYAYEDCVLRMVLPEQPWMALLKINSFEGNQVANHSKLYGMKVVAVGEG